MENGEHTSASSVSVNIRQHTSGYVRRRYEVGVSGRRHRILSIRQRIRQNTSAYLWRGYEVGERDRGHRIEVFCEQLCVPEHTSTYVSIRHSIQHTSSYVSICTYLYIPEWHIRRNKELQVDCVTLHLDIRQHTSVYVSIRQLTYVDGC